MGMYKPNFFDEYTLQNWDAAKTQNIMLFFFFKEKTRSSEKSRYPLDD
jgi:hypothetical protein